MQPIYDERAVARALADTLEHGDIGTLARMSGAPRCQISRMLSPSEPTPLQARVLLAAAYLTGDAEALRLALAPLGLGVHRLPEADVSAPDDNGCAMRMAHIIDPVLGASAGVGEVCALVREACDPASPGGAAIVAAERERIRPVLHRAETELATLERRL